MARTNIDLDEEALAAAQERLGTTTKKDTINQALRLVATTRGQQATADLLLALTRASDLDSPEIMEEAWRRTHPDSRGAEH